MRFVKLLLPILLLICGTQQVLAQSEEALRRLDSLKEDIALKSKEHDALQVDQKKLQKSLNTLNSKISDIAKKEKDLQAKLDTTTKDQEKVEKELVRIAKESRAVKAKSIARLRSVYMHRDEMMLNTLVNAAEGGSFTRTSYYLAKLRNYDKNIISRYLELEDQYSVKSEDLANLKDEQQSLKDKLTESKDLLKVKIKEQGKAKKKLDSKEVALENSLAGLRAQALRLEAIIASIAGGDDPISESVDKPETKIVRKQAPKFVPFEGDGLEKRKGKLDKPVEGSIVKTFGKQKVEGFRDIVFNKGVEFKTDDEDEAVRAVADGKVIYHGRMPGYGTLIIVDHGKRYYSLYGRLSKTRVEVGDAVEKGMKMARVEELEDGSGGRFYFEIRKAGKAVDPGKYLKKS